MTGNEAFDGVSFAFVHHVDELLVGRDGEQRIVGNVGDDSSFAQNAVNLIFHVVLQSFDGDG